jgi:hypothetical protein
MAQSGLLCSPSKKGSGEASADNEQAADKKITVKVGSTLRKTKTLSAVVHPPHPSRTARARRADADAPRGPGGPKQVAIMRRASDQASFYHLGVGHARQGGMAVVSALKDGLGGVGRTGPVSFSGAPVAATRPAPGSAGVRSAGCAAGP